MNVVNMCPHPIAVEGGYVPSHSVARCSESIEPAGTAVIAVSTPNGAVVDIGMPMIRVRRSAAMGIPAPAPDTIIVVSAMVAEAVRRPDVVAPYTGPDPRYAPIRKDGQIVAVRAFVQEVEE